MKKYWEGDEGGCGMCAEGEECLSMVILAGHPFFDSARPQVWYQEWCGKWIVKWRDFHTVRQDDEFTTEAEALAFAATVNVPPLTVYNCGCDLAENDAFWREMADLVSE